MIDLKQRKGKVVINRDIILQCDYDLLKELFSNVFPIHSEAIDYYNSIAYYCVSPHFREVAQGERTPEYKVVFEKNNDFIDRFKEVIEVK